MKHSQKVLYIVFLAIGINLLSCKDAEVGNPSPIEFGDPTLVVTEEDSSYLKNYTRDISRGGNQNQDDIAKMMHQVDSLKATQKLESVEATSGDIEGFEIRFKECDVKFDGLEAKELEAQDEQNLESVSYLVTKGDLESIKVSISGLTDVFVEERIFTKLELVNDEGKSLRLKSLNRKISDWFNLASNDTLFISAGANSFQFNNTDNEKIKTALEKEIIAQNLDKKESAAWRASIKETKNYTDRPCRVFVSTAQFRITAKYKGKKLRKLIQFDLLE